MMLMIVAMLRMVMMLLVVYEGRYWLLVLYIALLPTAADNLLRCELFTLVCLCHHHHHHHQHHHHHHNQEV